MRHPDGRARNLVANSTTAFPRVSVDNRRAMASDKLRAQIAANIAEARRAIPILQDFVEDEDLKAVLAAALADIAEYEAAAIRPRESGEDEEREARRLQRALDDWPTVVVQLRAVEEALTRSGPEASVPGKDPE